VGSAITVDVVCTDPSCNASAAATISLPGASRVYRLRSQTVHVARNRHAKLTLRPSRSVRAAVRRALAHHVRAKAQIAVTIIGSNGRRTTKQISVSLKR
jgi:hypothetical protein